MLSDETLRQLIDGRREREREASDERLAAQARGPRLRPRHGDERARVALFGRVVAGRRQALT